MVQHNFAEVVIAPQIMAVKIGNSVIVENKFKKVTDRFRFPSLKIHGGEDDLTFGGGVFLELLGIFLFDTRYIYHKLVSALHIFNFAFFFTLFIV